MGVCVFMCMCVCFTPIGAVMECCYTHTQNDYGRLAVRYKKFIIFVVVKNNVVPGSLYYTQDIFYFIYNIHFVAKTVLRYTT